MGLFLLSVLFAAVAGAPLWSSGKITSFDFSLGGFAPLGGDLYIIADADSNVLHLRTTTSNTSLSNVLLSTKPLSVAANVDSGVAYVAPTAGTFIMKAEFLSGGSASHILLPCTPASLSLGTKVLFVACIEDTFNGVIFAIDLATEKIIGNVTTQAFSGIEIAADPSNDFVVVWENGVSGGGACMWRVDVRKADNGLLNLTVGQGYTTGCGGSAAVSPDGEHIVYPCNGAGNGASLCDLVPDHLLQIQGSFTGSSPMIFSKDSSTFVSSSYNFGSGSSGLILSGVARHDVQANLTFPQSFSGSADQLAFSVGGSRLYVVSSQGQDLLWYDRTN